MEDKIANLITISPRIYGRTSNKCIGMDKLVPFRKFITGFTFKKPNGGARFQNEDTLLAKITPCLENGKTAYVNFLEKNEIAHGSTEFIVLRGKKDFTLNEFVYYLSISPLFRKMAVSAMTGTTGRQRVDEFVLGENKITIPSLPIQKAIAHTLSVLDDKIELNNKINAELENLAHTLYQWYFVQNKQDNWKVKKLKDIISIKTGKEDANFATDDGEYKFYTCGNQILRCNKPAFNGEAILIAGNGNFNVKFTGNEKFNAYQRTYVLQAIKGYESDIYRAFFAVVNTIKKFTVSSNGSITKFIRLEDIASISLPTPSEKILKEINSVLKLIFTQIANNTKQTTALAALRDFLLPILMNGQVTANNDTQVESKVSEFTNKPAYEDFKNKISVAARGNCDFDEKTLQAMYEMHYEKVSANADKRKKS